MGGERPTVNWLTTFEVNTCLAPLHRIGVGCGSRTCHEVLVFALSVPTGALALHDSLVAGVSRVQQSCACLVVSLWPVFIALSHWIIHTPQDPHEQHETGEDQELEAIAKGDEEGAGLGQVIGSTTESLDLPKRRKLCEECNALTPIDARHCEDCGFCVRGRDHHCGILGVCIGDANRRSFLMLLVLVGIACSSDLVLIWPRFLLVVAEVLPQSSSGFLNTVTSYAGMALIAGPITFVFTMLVITGFFVVEQLAYLSHRRRGTFGRLWNDNVSWNWPPSTHHPLDRVAS